VLIKQYSITFVTIIILIALSCVDVPATAPELTETVSTAKANAKIDTASDTKTLAESSKSEGDKALDSNSDDNSSEK